MSRRFNEESIRFHNFNDDCSVKRERHFLYLWLTNADGVINSVSLRWWRQIVRLLDFVWNIYDILGGRASSSDWRDLESIRQILSSLRNLARAVVVKVK